MVGALFTKISLKNFFGIAVMLFIVFSVPIAAQAQTTPTITFPGPPAVKPGTPPTLEELHVSEAMWDKIQEKCYVGPLVLSCTITGTNGVVSCERDLLWDPTLQGTCTITYTDGVTCKLGENIKEGVYAKCIAPSSDPNGEPLTSTSDSGHLGGGACSFASFDLLTCLQSTAGKLGASILIIFVMVFAAILGLVGGILNWVMLITVFQYSTYFGNSEGMLVAWSVLRDLGNIILLFGFIFIGLQTILNIGHFSVSKALPRLVIFAILINFSLFVSEAVVDVSNVFASTIYTQAEQVNCTDNKNMEECSNNGIAGRIMKESGFAGIFSVDSAFKEAWGSPNGVDMFFLYFCLIILVLVMIVVFIAAIILFIIRAVVLMLLLVTSPIGFVGMAIPQLEEFSSMWWKKLISNAIFAPVFLLMLLVGLKIMDGASGIFNAGGASLTVALMQGSTGTGGIFILYSLIIGFMVAALMSAKSLGAVGGSFVVGKATALGKSTLSGAKTAALYPGGVAARAGIGGIANAAQKAYEGKSGQRIRSIPIIGGMMDDTIAGGLKSAKAAKFGTNRSYEEDKKHHDARGAELAAATKKKEAQAEVNQAAADYTTAAAAGNTAGMTAAEAKMGDLLQRMSDAEIAELEQVKKGTAGIEQLTRQLSPEKFAALMKNEKFDDLKRDKFAGMRLGEVKAAITTGLAPGATPDQVAAAKKSVREMSQKDLELLAKSDPATFASLVSAKPNGALGGGFMSGEQHDKLTTSSELTNSQRGSIKGESKPAQFEAMFAGGTGSTVAASSIRKLSPAEIAKLPENILTNQEIAEKLTPAMLTAIQKKGDLSGDGFETIGNYIRAGGDADSKKYIKTGAGKGHWGS